MVRTSIGADRRIAWRAAAWGLAVAVMGTGTARAGNWTTYQGDNQHTGSSDSNLNPTTLGKVWSAPSNYSTPLVIGDTVYAMANQQGIGSATTKISSFDLATGAVNWTDSGSFVFPSQPGYGGGLLAFIGQPTGSTSSSLYVLDGATGAQLYTVALPSNFSGLTDPMPTLMTNSSGQLIAYLNDGSHAVAVTLGAASGSVAWESTQATFGLGSSIPTVVGNSLIFASPGHYYAVDMASGTLNQFHSGNISGGGGSTVVYDASRHEFYVTTAYDTSHFNAITAYSYTDNSHITQLWQHSVSNSPVTTGVALGPDGGVYAISNGQILELDPATGAVLRQVSTAADIGHVTPIIDQNALIAADNNNTYFYDLSTLALEKTLPGSIGGSGTGLYFSPGAISGDYFLLDNGPTYGSDGFVVYHGQGAVPEPSTAVLATAAIVGLGIAGRLRRRRGSRPAH